MGSPRQEYWSGLPFPSRGDIPDSGIDPGSPMLQAGSLLSEPPGISFPLTDENTERIQSKPEPKRPGAGHR